MHGSGEMPPPTQIPTGSYAIANQLYISIFYRKVTAHGVVSTAFERIFYYYD